MSPCSARLRFAERSHLIYSPSSGAAARVHADNRDMTVPIGTPSTRAAHRSPSLGGHQVD